MARHAALIAIAAALVTGAAHAGTAQVQFVEPDRYTDADRASFGRVERQRTLDALTMTFQSLAARHLGADETLRVEVLDIDLAGDLRMSSRSGAFGTRVLKGRADAPRMQFRYQLQRGGTLLASGEERLTDLGYLDTSYHAARYGADEALPHESRMLERWFEARLKAPQRQ